MVDARYNDFFLTRKQIADFAKDPRTVKEIEKLQRAIREQAPADIVAAQDAADAAQADADAAQADATQGIADAAAAQATADAAQPGDSMLTSLSALNDPNADKILFWDDSAGNIGFLEPAGNLAITGTDLDATSGAAAWALAGTGQTATGVYDFAVDGAKANIDFAGLGSFNELLVHARGLTDGTTGVRVLRVSVDGGATFFATAGDYVNVSTAGVESNTTGFAHGTNSTAARTLIVHIRNMKGAAKSAQLNNDVGPNTLFVASASDIDAIRVTNTGGGNITAGTVRVYAR